MSEKDSGENRNLLKYFQKRRKQKQNEGGDRYWITTEPTVTRWNKNGTYEIRMKYSVHKESKYNDKIYEFTK